MLFVTLGSPVLVNLSKLHLTWLIFRKLLVCFYGNVPPASLCVCSRLRCSGKRAPPYSLQTRRETRSEERRMKARVVTNVESTVCDGREFENGVKGAPQVRQLVCGQNHGRLYSGHAHMCHGSGEASTYLRACPGSRPAGSASQPGGR